MKAELVGAPMERGVSASLRRQGVGDRGSSPAGSSAECSSRGGLAVFCPEPDVHPNQGGRLPGRRSDRSSWNDRRADAPLRAAGEGVFHEFHTAAVWPVRLGSAPAGLPAGGPGEPAVALQRRCRRYLSPWLPSRPVRRPTRSRTSASSVWQPSLINPNNPNSPGLSNEGKVVSGTDREGDKWTITVHGPGKVIVTDTTPNDGALDDDINTIQLVGTSLEIDLRHRECDRVEPIRNCTDRAAIILFNELIATSGVKSIELNGFDAVEPVTPAVTNPTGVFLYGGVRNALVRQHRCADRHRRSTRAPYQIVIGDANTPLKVQPSIYLNNITNLVFNSTTDRPRFRRRR